MPKLTLDDMYFNRQDIMASLTMPDVSFLMGRTLSLINASQFYDDDNDQYTKLSAIHASLTRRYHELKDSMSVGPNVPPSVDGITA